MSGAPSEEALEAAQDGVATLGLRDPTELSGVSPLEEGDQAGTAVGWRVVEDDLGGAGQADRLAAQSVLAPERFLVDRHALDHRAHRHSLGELVARPRERRVVVDPAGERGRHRDDGAAGTHLAGDDSIRVGADRAYRRGELHAVPELLGHPDRELLGPARQPVLLGAALGLEQVVPAARRCGVEEDVE